MQLGRILKKAFGFDSPEEEEAELEGIDATVIPRRIAAPSTQRSSGESEHTHPASTKADNNADASDIKQPQSTPCAVPDAIFTSVVEVFDATLPEFLQRSVDGKSQREYLYSLLNEDMKRYLASLEADAEERCRLRWAGESEALRKQMEEVREKARKEEGERDDAKNKQLSAERQKRALSERVHDLEKQVASLEAENEQYVLENKSLVNKLRITSVTGGAVDADSALTKEIEELHGKLQQNDARIKELTDSRRALENERNTVTESLKNAEASLQEREHSIADLSASLQESNNVVQTLQSEVGKLQEALEQSRVKDDLGDAMLTELNSKASRAMQEAEQLRQTIAGLQKENTRLEQEAGDARKMAENMENLRKAAVDELGSLRQEHGLLKTALDEESAKLQEAMKNLAIVEELSVKLDGLEEAKRNSDSRQRQQTEEITRLNESVARLSKENEDYAAALLQKEELIRGHEKIADSLRKTIENNLYEHAQAESALRSEIDRLSGRGHRPDAVSMPENSLPDGLMDMALPGDDTLDSTDFVLDSSDRKKEGKNKKKKPSISAIDDSIENADWLVAVPAVPSKKPVPPRDDSDFGYREPERKPTPPDNPAQVSLW